MARVSYVDEQSHPELTGVIEKIRSQRRGKLIPVYGLLLHSPDVAQAWMELLNAVRWKTALSPRLREIVILRVAALNQASYVIDVHRQHFAQADGLTHQECELLLRTEEPATLFSDLERGAVDYVDQLTRSACVSEATFKKLRAHLDERQIVELSVLVGTYNMHTRVLNALQIDPE